MYCDSLAFIIKNGPLKNLAEVKGGLLAHDKSAEQCFTEFGEGQP